MSEVTVHHIGDMLFETKDRDHSLQMEVSRFSGKDRAISPGHAFLSSLAACVAAFVSNYCQNVGIDISDLSVKLSCDELDNPRRYENLKVTVKIPHGDLARRERAILSVAEHCPIHETILNTDRVEFAIEK